MMSASDWLRELLKPIAAGVGVGAGVELHEDAEGPRVQDPKRGRDVTWIISAGGRIRSDRPRL